jgi:hypothetical protein
MKKLLTLISVLCLFAGVQSCSEEERSSIKPSSASISFTVEDLSMPSEELVESHSLFVSVTTKAGAEILIEREIKFNKDGETFLTESLDLSPGEYVLTGFRISNNGETIFEIPERRSSYSDHTGNTLPFPFTVSGKHVETLELQAKKASKASTFKLGVYANSELVSATAHLMLDDVVVDTYYLDPKLNKLPFDLDPTVAYTLVIIKDGYSRYISEFIFDQIGNHPWKIFLAPAFTINAIANPDLDNQFEFSLNTVPGSTLTVDWGDGTSESFAFTSASSHDFTKLYPVAGEYFVTVTGDIDQITDFYSFYGHGMMNGINFEQLTALVEVRLGLTTGPSVIDLSHNLNIQDVRLPGVPELTDLILPVDHQIHFIDISGPNSLTSAKVDYVINSVYTNAVSHSITNGNISVAGSWWEAPEEPLFIGPPSTAALEQLVKLRDIYFWAVAPTF